jgi:hypothetical protein
MQVLTLLVHQGQGTCIRKRTCSSFISESGEGSMKRISRSVAVIAAATFCLHVNGVSGQNAEWREREYPGHDRNADANGVRQGQQAEGTAAEAESGDGSQRKPEAFEGGQSPADTRSDKSDAGSQSDEQRKPETFEGGQSQAGPSGDESGAQPKQ